MNREIIDRVKKENGNHNFTQKDMIFYLVNRVDSICDKLEKGSDKIADNRTSIAEIKASGKTLNKVLGFLFTALGIYVTYLGATR